MRKRLLQDSHRSPAHAMLLDGIIGVSRHVQGMYLRKQGKELTREFRTRHARHNDVREQQVQSPFVLGGNAQRVRTAGRRQDTVTRAEQNFRSHSPHSRIIFDQKYRLATRAEVERFLDHLRFNGPRNARQERLERAPCADFTFRPDIAAALLYNSVDRREPEPRSLPFFFRSEERFKKRVSEFPYPCPRPYPARAERRTHRGQHRAGRPWFAGSRIR